MAEDRYANIATISVTFSAANTATFQELPTQLGIQSDRKTAVAMLIDQIDYFTTNAALLEMTTAGDSIHWMLSISNGIANFLDFADRRVLHTTFLHRADFGTAAGGQLVQIPITKQFFPPLVVAERSLYLGGTSVGLASAAVIHCRIYYRTVTLTDSQFLEISEVFRLVS